MTSWFETDVPAALELMMDEGYEPRFRFSRAEQRRFVRYQNEHSLLRRDDSVLVELQWSVAPRYFAAPLDFEVMFERLDTLQVGWPGGADVPPEDLFLMLCIHGAKHLWERLAWVCDLHELGKIHRISWERLTARAERGGTAHALARGPPLEIFSAPNCRPRWPGASRRTAMCEPLRLEIERTLVGSRRRPLTASEIIVSSWRLRLGAARELRYVGRLGLTPTVGDWEFVSLPPRLAPLYYVIRPIRLFRQRVERSQRPT